MVAADDVVAVDGEPPAWVTRDRRRRRRLPLGSLATRVVEWRRDGVGARDATRHVERRSSRDGAEAIDATRVSTQSSETADAYTHLNGFIAMRWARYW